MYAKRMNAELLTSEPLKPRRHRRNVCLRRRSAFGLAVPLTFDLSDLENISAIS